jgi:hypothetical protein
MKKMKFIKMILALVAVSLSLTSCLEHGLEDLPTYEGNDITAGYAYYRYIDESSETLPVSGEHRVYQKQLRRAAQTIDNDATTCALSFSVPTNSTETERNGVRLDNLVVMVDISTAAVLEPVEGSPKLGTPADWTQPHKYSVKAADGKTKVWTITVSLTK